MVFDRSPKEPSNRQADPAIPVEEVLHERTLMRTSDEVVDELVPRKCLHGVSARVAVDAEHVASVVDAGALRRELVA
jgi:hypothetical protein